MEQSHLFGGSSKFLTQLMMMKKIGNSLPDNERLWGGLKIEEWASIMKYNIITSSIN